MQSTRFAPLLLFHGRILPLCHHHPLYLCIAPFSSKTPIKSSLGTANVPNPTHRDGSLFPYQEIPASQGFPLVSPASSTLLSPSPYKRHQPRKRKEILRMEESELEGYAILQFKGPLIERRGEAPPNFLRTLNDIHNAKKRSNVDLMTFLHGDWEVTPHSIRKWWASLDAEIELKEQAFNPIRNKVLGNDLAIAHFIVARKGRVRFQNKTEWISEYRIDAKPGVDELDLPVMRHDLCSLPVHFDPRFRVEAIDCTGIPLLYEGLVNFQNLNFVKWLSFKNTPYIDDWCLDRISRIFYETLEYIDLSGCTLVSERGVGALIKCKNLKTLVVENMSHARNLEMVTAMLEDELPELEVIGVDYQQRMEQLRIEGEEIERKLLQAETALEENTINIDEPISIPHQPSEETPSTSHHR